MDNHLSEDPHKEIISSISGLKGKYYNLTYLNSMSNGKVEFLHEMIEVFLNQVKEYKHSIHKALEDGKWNDIHKSTHKFKSSLRIMGIEHMILHFERINALAKQHTGLDEIKHLVATINEFCIQCVEELELFRKNS